MSRRGRARRTSLPSASLFTGPLTLGLLRPLAQPSSLQLIEDRRLYHPLDDFRPARKTSGHPVEPVTVKKTPLNKSRAFLAHGLSFHAPNRVVICVRRKQRKEVLHALKKVGRGKGHGRKRRNWYSKIGC